MNHEKLEETSAMPTRRLLPRWVSAALLGGITAASIAGLFFLFILLGLYMSDSTRGELVRMSQRLLPLIGRWGLFGSVVGVWCLYFLRERQPEMHELWVTNPKDIREFNKMSALMAGGGMGLFLGGIVGAAAGATATFAEQPVLRMVLGAWLIGMSGMLTGAFVGLVIANRRS